MLDLFRTFPYIHTGHGTPPFLIYLYIYTTNLSDHLQKMHLNFKKLFTRLLSDEFPVRQLCQLCGKR